MEKTTWTEEFVLKINKCHQNGNKKTYFTPSCLLCYYLRLLFGCTTKIQLNALSLLMTTIDHRTQPPSRNIVFVFLHKMRDLNNFC